MKTIKINKMLRAIYTINGKPDPMAYLFTIVIVLIIICVLDTFI
jgi:hypothetical protein